MVRLLMDCLAAAATAAAAVMPIARVAQCHASSAVLAVRKDCRKNPGSLANHKPRAMPDIDLASRRQHSLTCALQQRSKQCCSRQAQNQTCTMQPAAPAHLLLMPAEFWVRTHPNPCNAYIRPGDLNQLRKSEPQSCVILCNSPSMAYRLGARLAQSKAAAAATETAGLCTASGGSDRQCQQSQKSGQRCLYAPSIQVGSRHCAAATTLGSSSSSAASFSCADVRCSHVLCPDCTTSSCSLHKTLQVHTTSYHIMLTCYMLCLMMSSSFSRCLTTKITGNEHAMHISSMLCPALGA